MMKRSSRISMETLASRLKLEDDGNGSGHKRQCIAAIDDGMRQSRMKMMMIVSPILMI